MVVDVAGDGGGLQPVAEPFQAGLAESLPAEAAVANPVDMVASALPEHYRRTVELVAASGKVDALFATGSPRTRPGRWSGRWSTGAGGGAPRGRSPSRPRSATTRPPPCWRPRWPTGRATLVEAHPEIAELDCNPVMALPHGAVVVDARIQVETASPPLPVAARHR